MSINLKAFHDFKLHQKTQHFKEADFKQLCMLSVSKLWGHHPSQSCSQLSVSGLAPQQLILISVSDLKLKF